LLSINPLKFGIFRPRILSMNHIYEQILYTTIGTLKISKNKFLELMEDLIQNQPYAEDEGKRINCHVQIP
jgi:hypothetical protein